MTWKFVVEKSRLKFIWKIVPPRIRRASELIDKLVAVIFIASVSDTKQKSVENCFLLKSISTAKSERETRKVCLGEEFVFVVKEEKIVENFSRA